MITLNFENHNINLAKIKSLYIISPKYFKDVEMTKEESMGDIILNKEELARLIVNVTELLHT